jgi:integrase
MGKRRGNGEGTVSKVKTGWKAVVTLGYRDGKRITKSRTERSKADAQAWIAQSQAERNAAQGKPDLPTGLLFCEWIETFLKDCQRDRATNTHQRYRDVLYRFVNPTLGRIPLAELRPMAFRNLLSELEADYAGTRTLDSVYEVSKTCLMAAVKLDLIPTNPVSKVSRPKYKRADIQPFEIEDVWLILARLRPHRLHSLFVLAFALGLRQGELFALEWRDVDFSAGVLRIERQAIAPRGKLEIKPPKTKAGRRTLEITPEVGVALEERRRIALIEKLAHCPLVFPGARGSYLQSNTFAKRHWKPTLAACGLAERGLHHARHTFATHALLSGEALHVVSKILGHASPTVTLNTYSHLVGVSQSETLDRVARLFSTASPLHPATLKIHSPKAS